MTLQVIGAGFGRTGTFSLRSALEMLGFAPCYHMFSVTDEMALRVPHWTAALAGRPDWQATFAGFQAAVDWPTAAFWRELADALPRARVILSTRDPESWADSISQTIFRALEPSAAMSENRRAWAAMTREVIIERSLGGRTDRAGLIAAFRAHEQAVRDTLPPERLLVFRAGDGWVPLCDFLGVPVPDAPYPHTNSRDEFRARLPKRQRT